MDSGLIAARYAKALFLSALDRGEEERVYRDVQRMERILKEEPRLGVHLSGPTLSKPEKRELLENIGGYASTHTLRFLSLLIEKRREAKLLPILLLYIEMYRKHRNITTVGIETAVPLDAAIENKIMKMVSDKTHGEVEVINRVRPEVLGGYIVYIDDYRLDKSVATELKRLRSRQSTAIGR